MGQLVLAGALAVALGAAAVLFHPMAGVGLGLGLGVVAWALLNPFNTMMLFVFVFVLRPEHLLPSVFPVESVKLIGIAAMFFWFATKLFQGDLRVSRAPQIKWVLALVAGLVLSAVASSESSASLTSLAYFAKVVVVFAVLVHLIDTKERAVKFHLILAISMATIALFSIYQRAAGLTLDDGVRASYGAWLSDANLLAIAFVMNVPLAAELAFGTTGFKRVCAGLLFALLVAGVLATVSRGGALCLAIALLATLYDRGRAALRLFFLPGIVASLFGLLLLAGLNDRASGSLDGGQLDASALNRLYLWEGGVRIAFENPVLGVGFGQARMSIHEAIQHQHLDRAVSLHNTFVELAADTGLVGFVPFMVLIFLSLRIALRLRRDDVSEDTPTQRAVRRSLFPSMSGFFVGAFFITEFGHFLFIILAQAATMHEIWKPTLTAVGSGGRIGTEPALASLR